ncbi:MAG: HU family DNA-binding protein [Candidatus Loosdrechtia sp.]|uniref:HU family DNA-binding protein n=1 Tax=Candidatus Loosdrechtia sp. TaxID=3101272 RepID=UPI003A676067|nr:MAG: HU family DNA-binding protein [Candidatus Jettenia sp. AMX2]
MNKQDLIDNVAKELEISAKKAEEAVNTIINNIQKGLKKDKRVQLIGFGSFEVRTRKARKGRNPQTGEVIKIKASKTVAFKAGKKMKAMI